MTSPSDHSRRPVDDGGTAWMLAARVGDRAAFDRVVLRLTPALTRTAYRFAAPTYIADVVQETWLRAWQYRHTYRGDARPATWLRQIMANVVTRDRALRPTPSVETDVAQLAGIGDAEAGYQQLVTDSIERAVFDGRSAMPWEVQELLKVMSHEEATALRIRAEYWTGKSSYGALPEIARRLQITNKAAENLVNRAEERFLALWRRAGHDNPDERRLAGGSGRSDG